MFDQGRSTINVWAGIVGNCITAPMFLSTSIKSATYLRFLRSRLLIELREIMRRQRRRCIYFVNVDKVADKLRSFSQLLNEKFG